jgi:hypothetical protein
MLYDIIHKALDAVYGGFMEVVFDAFGVGFSDVFLNLKDPKEFEDR